MAFFACDQNGCQSRQTICWKDPERSGRHLGINSVILKQWAELLCLEEAPFEALRNQYRSTSPPATIKQQLRRHSELMLEARRMPKTKEPPQAPQSTGPVTNLMFGGMPFNGMMMPGMQLGVQPGMPWPPPPYQQLQNNQSPDRSSLPSEGSTPRSCVEYCRWIIQHNQSFTVALQSALLDAGKVLDRELISPRETYYTVKNSGEDQLKALGLKIGVIK
jgi:hypothetical protein